MARPRDFNDIIPRLESAVMSRKGKRHGDEITFQCPNPSAHKHGDNDPSANYNVTKRVWICPVCGEHGNYYDLALRLDLINNGSRPDGYRETGRWQIGNANHIRLEKPGGKKRVTWEHDGKSGLAGLRTEDLPLYNGEALKDNPDVDALVGEGERKTDGLVALGFVAVGTACGASVIPSRQSLEPLAKHQGRVFLCHDNDNPGKVHMKRIAARLKGMGKIPYMVGWPGVPEGGDASDFIKAGHVASDIQEVLDKAPLYEGEAETIEKTNEGVSLVCIAEVESETVSWLWFPYIPKGKVTLLEGDPGIGKSWVSLAIARAVTLGKGLPGQEPTEPSNVVIASAEDGLGDTIRPRLDAMAANVKNIHAIKGTLDFGNGGLAILEGYIEQVRPALVIIDPLVAYIGAGVDIHRANETRAVMAKLADIAEQHGCAILAVRHLTKGGTLKPIYRGLGSIDFAAACRSVLMAGCDPDNPQKRGIVQIKSNLAPMGAAIGYELRDGGFYWTGESDLTVARILAIEDSEGKSARDEAADFLRDELANGPVEAAQVWRDAREAGLSERTLNRAKSKMGIITRRHGEAGKRGGGKFTWELPEDLDCHDCHIEDTGNVNQTSFNNHPETLSVGNVNTPEAVLGMPVEKAIELWRSEGAPVIYLGPGENCFDLEKLLSNPYNERYLKAIRAWLDKVLKRRSEL